jgi:hypothetical protein
MREVIDILATPGEVLKRIQDKPKCCTPLALCASIFFLLAWLNGCWRNFSEAFTWANLLGPALISPLIVGIVSLGTTAFIYLLTLILGGPEARETTFKTLYSLNIHCGLIFLLGEVANFLLLRTSILDNDPTPLQGRFPVGLDILLLGVENPNLYLSIILHSTSVFLIWYLVVLSQGIRVVTGTSKAKAAAIVTMLWCTLVLMALGMIYAAGGSTTIRIRL